MSIKSIKFESVLINFLGSRVGGVYFVSENCGQQVRNVDSFTLAQIL